MPEIKRMNEEAIAKSWSGEYRQLEAAARKQGLEQDADHLKVQADQLDAFVADKAAAMPPFLAAKYPSQS
ncbi:MAG: hypothetical protein ACM3KM_02710 [Acidobacteriaceae bacterium]